MSENKNPIIVKCPHCQEYIEILEINCAIFRHGILKDSGQQIDPHASKELCSQYIEHDLIYGCGKPFKVIVKDNILETEICDYI
jgi:hypothetical protein